MRIEFDIGVANDPDAHRWLDRILYKIEDGWHVWDTTTLSEPEELEAAAWICDRGPQCKWVHEMLVASIQRSAWTPAPHGRRVRVTTHPTGVGALGPEDAARLAEEPLVILVENRFSDGAFVKRIVADLDRSLNKLWHRPGAPIRFDSPGGGGQMPEEVERRALGAPYPPRLVVIVDSDRKGPGERKGEVARKLRRKCEELGVSCWVLAKREAENYLPRILLDEKPDAGLDHTRLVEAWDRLSDDQKDFFDMKKGLPEVPSAMEATLFASLPPPDRAILSRGFGPDVDRCWKIWNVQAESELRRRGRGDLERGIELIRQEV